MYSKQRGVVAIEFALGFLVFFSMLVFWVEVSYMGYVSSMVDYTIAEASRESKNKSKDDYKEIFKTVINKNGSLWSAFINVEKLTIKTRYYTSVDSLVLPCTTDTDGDCAEVGSPNNSPLAVYTLKYDYTPLYTFFFNQGESLNITREIVAIQEYERSKFNG